MSKLELKVNFDGGSRGNPGPAAAGAVVQTAAGEVISEVSELLGSATNNVAEYRALLLGIRRALELGATQLALIGDSELVAKQIRGEYRVKNADLKKLHSQAIELLESSLMGSWSILSVPREQNKAADALVNEALDSGQASKG